MQFVDFFSGIGGVRLGLEQAGHKCVGFCEFDKYARQSYKAMYDTEGEWESHDVTQVHPYDVPDADLWTFGFPCFPAGTLVKTDRGLVPIEVLKIGDNVLTHQKRYKPIVQLMSRQTEQTYHIKAYGTENLVTTAEHPFYVTKKSRVWNSERRSYGRHFDSFEWVKAKDLTTGYYMTIPIEQEEKPIEWSGKLPLGNEAFYLFIGKWLGDGWTLAANDHNSEKVILCCGKHKLNETQIMLNKLGLHYTQTEERTVYKFIFCNKELYTFLRRYGHGAGNKFVHQEILQLPKNLLEKVIDGYLSSDGCKIGNRYKATTISRKLAYGMAACVNKVYHRGCAVYYTKRPQTCVIEGRTVNQHDTYDIVFCKDNNKQDKAFYKNGYICVPIRKVEVKYEQCTVYNIGVKEDESYTANAICVHNCQDISVAGKQKGLQAGERSGLFYEIMRLLAGRRKEDRPKWLFVENVKNLLSIGNGFDFARLLIEMGGHGYSISWCLLNSKDWGVPQNRQRVFLVGSLGNERCREVFPLTSDDGENTCKLQEVTSGRPQAERIYSADGLSCTLSSQGGGLGAKTGLYQVLVKIDKVVGVERGGGMHTLSIKSTGDELASTLCARDYKGFTKGSNGVLVKAVLTPDRIEKRQNGRRMKEDGEPMFTLTAQDRHGVAIVPMIKRGYDLVPTDVAATLDTSRQPYGNQQHTVCIVDDQGRKVITKTRIRKLTPRECWRLQGFPDNYIDKVIATGVSDTQMYKQSGNAVTVNVAYAIGKRLKEIENNENKERYEK